MSLGIWLENIPYPKNDSYVKEAINNVNKHMKEEKMEFNRKFYDIIYSSKNPFYSVEYRLELNNSAECTEYQVNLFHNQIGIIRWIIELDRIDISF